MSDDRLPTHIWVMAHIRRCMDANIPAMIIHKGEASSGTLLIKLNLLEGSCRVLSQARDIDGNLGWLGAFKADLVAEAEADAYIARAISRDPDLWVVEIEDRQGVNPFDGKII